MHPRTSVRLSSGNATWTYTPLSVCACIVLAAFSLCCCDVYEPSLVQLTERTGRSPVAGAGAASSTRIGGSLQIPLECTENRPTCARAKASTSCQGDACIVHGCDGSFGDCDQWADNGCEADLSSIAHCGRCHTGCSFMHGQAICRQGQCALLGCHTGYADCDGLEANGCESSLNSAGSCGGCGRTCPADLPQASAICSAGECLLQCLPGYGDCNGRTQDGCEQALTAAGTCGACNTNACVGPHVQLSECANGPCRIISCSPGFEDCNGVIQDGCEVDLLTAQNCGECAARCSLPHVAAMRCEAGAVGVGAQCVIDRSCSQDELDCSVTRQRGCADGYADCDGVGDNGCETDLRRLDHCGSCSNSCVAPGESRNCRDGVCVSSECAAGYARCVATGACRSLQDDPQNCGECGRSCPASAPYCAGGRCTALDCGPGIADCDGDVSNRCESSLNALEQCGGCDLRCGSAPHARSLICQDASCQIGSCEPGFADCDQEAKNGCEVSIDTDDDCGGCGMSCLFPQGIARCSHRKCTLVDCSQGRGDCNGSVDDGCEDDLRSTEHCGRCGQNCNALPNVAASSCIGGVCELSCQSSFADCDGLAENGCEANLTVATSCGSCQNDCSRLANVAQAGCSAGRCEDLFCNAGFGDCNALSADGCEQPLNTVEHCAACQRRCQPAHAPADCGAGVCGHQGCENGYGDCDGNSENGCETRLDSPDHCGGCGIACEAGAPCKDGECGCATDMQCGPGASCCNNECTDTVGECFPFPCIPGTARPNNNAHCGGCEQVCLLFCCGPLF